LNALASQLARGLAAAVALTVCCVSGLTGAGLTQVALRSAGAFVLTWIAADIAARQILKGLLMRALERSKSGKIDVTLH